MWVYVVSYSTELFLGRSFDISELLSVTCQRDVGLFHSWEVGFLNFWANLLYKSKDTQQYKYGSVKMF